MFSSRVFGHHSTNRLAAAVAARRRAARPTLDLTITNPTTCGFHYPPGLLASLASEAAATYSPEPFGLRSAREAVAGDYARRGTGVAKGGVDPARIVLTASTSEAYSLLLKLLCEPSGDEVLVPTPSYPLFDHLTRLDGVGARPYLLEYHGRWEVNDASVDTGWTGRTRAVLAVSPNNPTGSLLAPSELAALSARCAEHGAALIVDEVFADYVFAEVSPAAGEAAPPGPLTFRLGGLSKSAGLPQVKLGWFLVDGPSDLVDEALARLELICDTYLSVSTPVQLAAPGLIAGGGVVREQILARTRRNFDALRAAAAAHPAVELLNADGGWAAVLRVPSRETEEALVLRLLDERDTLVHPGFFFDFPRETFLVVSLLPPPSTFDDGVSRMLEHVGG